MSLPRYPEYKDSRVEWLGSIPAHWQTRRTKFLFELMKRPVADGDGIVTAFRDGQVTLRSNRRVDGFTNALQEIGYQGVRSGDLVIHAMDAFAGAIGVSDSDGKSTPVYSVCRARSGRANPHYYAGVLRYMALGGFINSLAKGVRERSTDFRWTDAAALELPLPPLAEQSAICKFINREVARIDRLIAEQEKLLALLAEKRQATISHAVTRGLDPNVPMKDPGIAWLSEVPARWPVIRLKNAVPHVTVGIVVEPSRHYVDEGIPALRSLNVSGGEILMENLVYISQASNEELSKSKLQAGDLVVVRSGKAGAAAIVPPELDGCNCIDLIIIRKPVSGSEQFLNWYLASDAALRQFEGGSEGAIQKHFNIGTAANLTLPWPSLEEQVEIAQYLDSQVHAIGKLQELTESSLELLKERRIALISAAVTGQIDVRGLVEAETA